MLNKKCLRSTAAALVAVALFAASALPQGLVRQAHATPAPVSAAGKTSVLTPSAPGTTVKGNSQADIDISNASEGYVGVRYTGGGSARIKVLIKKSGSSTTYQFNLNTSGNYEYFPFSQGNGSYSVTVYQNAGGDSYAQLATTDVDVSLRNSMLPFMYANQYVNFNSKSTTVTTGESLAKNAANDLALVSEVYNYVIKNLSYDYDKAANVKSGYLPSVDNILASQKGICFDYAAVMATMLRTQQVPCKLVVGYSGQIYHAWINVYITDVGWVNGLIQFDGKNWKLMDPTFADNGNQSSEIMTYINNSANYSPIYYY